MYAAGTYLIQQPSPSSWCLDVPRNASANTAVAMLTCQVLKLGQHFILQNSTSTSAAATADTPATTSAVTTAAAAGSYLIVHGFCVVPACSTCNNASSLILSKCDFLFTSPGLRSVMKQGPASALRSATQQIPSSNPQARWHYQRSSGELMWLGAAPSNITLCLTLDQDPHTLYWLPLLTANGCAAVGGTPTAWRLVSAGRRPEHAVLGKFKITCMEFD
jgi:hypothetical protein